MASNKEFQNSLYKTFKDIGNFKKLTYRTGIFNLINSFTREEVVGPFGLWGVLITFLKGDFSDELSESLYHYAREKYAISHSHCTSGNHFKLDYGFEMEDLRDPSLVVAHLRDEFLEFFDI